MTGGRLQKVEDIFHAALERNPDQVSAFLDEACAGDESLQREVEALVASHQRAGSFIEEPLVALDPALFTHSQADRLIGESIGPYRITQAIGVGGMGAVYRARRDDQQYEKIVAIKVIKTGMDGNTVLRHFRNERQILASFDHPNIARLLDGGTTESGLSYFVMEFVEGLAIDKYCEKQGLSIDERLKLFRQVCDAVAYAHRHAVIHRDIKPSNILVSSDGVPKLLDFGIAKILQAGEDGEALATMTGLRLMTPEYASPEQVRGAPLTTATDVYSLGVVLYQLLTGHLPYQLPSHSLYDIAHVIGESEPPRPSTMVGAEEHREPASAGSQAAEEGRRERLRRLLRGDLDNIVLMALRKEPTRRYQSVEQFSEDIRRHLENLPVLARKDTLTYRTAKFVRRNLIATAAAALVFLSLVGGMLATSWQARRARAQEGVAKAEKARAERRFNDVRQLARSVLFDYHDAIKDLAGATPVRERLVKDALRYLDSLAGEAVGDPELQRELAAAYERVGDVRGQVYSASLGDTSGAMDSYLKALRIREALVAAAPQDAQGRRDLAASHAKVGTQLLEMDQAKQGIEHLRHSLVMYGQLAEEQPTSAEAGADLAAAYNELGLALENFDLAEALECHRKALTLRERSVNADPNDATRLRNLSVTYVNLGRALVLRGDIKEGLESNQKGLKLRSEILARDPNNADYRRLLAISYQNDGDYRLFLGDVRGALQSFRRKLALDERAFAQDPRNVQSGEDLAYSCYRIGYLLAELGDYVQAHSYHRRALVLAEKLWAAAPENLSMRYGAILARAHVAQMEARLGKRALARSELSRTIDLLNDTPPAPAHNWQSSIRAQVYLQVAETHAALATSKDAAVKERREHWLEARRMYTQSLDVLEEMKKRGMLTGEDADKPQAVRREIAKIDLLMEKKRSGE